MPAIGLGDKKDSQRRPKKFNNKWGKINTTSKLDLFTKHSKARLEEELGFVFFSFIIIIKILKIFLVSLFAISFNYFKTSCFMKIFYCVLIYLRLSTDVSLLNLLNDCDQDGSMPVLRIGPTQILPF